MAFSRRRSCRPKRTIMSEMNVTPMIDVMLVLLVIFMMTAPMLTVGVKVNLPSARAPNVDMKETPIVVHLDEYGKVYIGEIEVDENTLTDKLKAIAGETDAKVFVRGDKSLPYGTIMGVMGQISSAGFKRVILVTELPKAKRFKNAAR